MDCGLLGFSYRRYEYAIVFSPLAVVTDLDIILYILPHAWPPISQHNKVVYLLHTRMSNVEGHVFA